MLFFSEIALREYIFILLFFAFYIIYFIIARRKAKKIGKKLRYIILKPTLRFFYFGLIILALLGPVFGGEYEEVKVSGKDIFFVVDVSQSMDAKDIQPSRLEKTKISIKNTIDALAGYRMGLVVFSADAVLQCPLTTDRSLLFDIFVRSLNTQMLSSGGTNIATALELIAGKFKKQDELNALNKRRNSTKILVLFTDGEDFGENYRKATRLLSDLGVRLFVVGVGTPEGGNMPTANGSLKKNSSGEVIVTHLNSTELRTIAREAGGKYFEISTEINNMPQLISDIDNTKGSLQMNMEVFVSANKYFYFLWAAFAMLILDVLITIRTIKI